VFFFFFFLEQIKTSKEGKRLRSTYGLKNGEAGEGGREEREDHSWSSQASRESTLHQLQQFGKLFFFFLDLFRLVTLSQACQIVFVNRMNILFTTCP
jgi:hypothetical protein